MARLLPMSPSHLPQVLALERAANAHPWSEANLRDSLQSGYTAWVLVDEDPPQTVIGYAIVMIAAGEAQILNIGVTPRRQRSGHGRQLLEAILDAAREASCEMVLLEVRCSNAAAIALYQRYGFTRIGLRKRYYRSDDGTGEDALVLSLPLESRS